LQVGIFNDKYNMFGPKSFDHMYTNLQRRLAVTDFRVWRRALSDADVAAYERGAPILDGLAAHWPLVTLPDSDGNYRDRVAGHLLHHWRYRVWE
jgi:hypothetical protein